MEVFATIQSFNFYHFFCGQCEIEEVKVLLHTIFVNRFRNDNHIILKEEMKGCLCSSFSVFFIDLCQNRIGVLELKVDHKPEEAIAQIKEKEYALRFQGKTAERKEYTGHILAVGISYNSKPKEHECKIEQL